MRSDYIIAKGIFIALSYHMGGVIYSMIYDNDRNVCVSEIGPVLKFVEEFALDSPKLVGYYGEEIRDALIAFKEKQNAKPSGLLTK